METTASGGKNTFTDEEYFSSYEDLEIHRLMVADAPRTEAYQRAIEANRHRFEGRTVMDVGAGTGILSLLAARAGAARVYAVEASGTARLLGAVARDNGYGDVVTVLKGRVEEVRLPDDVKVDVIVSEWMGFYLLHESMLDSVLYARDHFLKDDGLMFPSEARLYAAPCELKELYKEQVEYWSQVYGFDMSAVGKAALASKATKPQVIALRPEALLAEPVCFKKFNLQWTEQSDVASFSEDVFVDVARAGRFDGVCVWFECDFDGRDYDEGGETKGDLVTLSTAPHSPLTHWKQVVIAFGGQTSAAEDSLEVASNKALSTEESCRESNVMDVVGRTASPQSLKDRNGKGVCDRLKGSSVEATNKKQKVECSDSCSNSKSESISYTNSNNESNISNKEKPQNGVNKENSEGCSVGDDVTSEPYGVLLEKDEVIGWSLGFEQSSGCSRHYSLCLAVLDPSGEHPEECHCSMPRCLIIRKMIEKEMEC